MKSLNKIKRKKGKGIYTAIIMLAIFIIMFLIITNIANYYKGLKNVDSNFNYGNIVIKFYEDNAKFKEGVKPPLSLFEVTDIGSDGVDRPLFRYYIAGLNTMEKSFLMNMFLMLLLGVILGTILNEND